MLTILGAPRELALVSNDTSSEGGTVVAAETYDHDTDLGHSFVCLDRLGLQNRSLTLLVLGEHSEAVLV